MKLPSFPKTSTKVNVAAVAISFLAGSAVVYGQLNQQPPKVNLSSQKTAAVSQTTGQSAPTTTSPSTDSTGSTVTDQSAPADTSSGSTNSSASGSSDTGSAPSGSTVPNQAQQPTDTSTNGSSGTPASQGSNVTVEIGTSVPYIVSKTPVSIPTPDPDMPGYYQDVCTYHWSDGTTTTKIIGLPRQQNTGFSTCN